MAITAPGGRQSLSHAQREASITLARILPVRPNVLHALLGVTVWLEAHFRNRATSPVLPIPRACHFARFASQGPFRMNLVRALARAVALAIGAHVEAALRFQQTVPLGPIEIERPHSRPVRIALFAQPATNVAAAQLLKKRVFLAAWLPTTRQLSAASVRLVSIRMSPQQLGATIVYRARTAR